MRRGEREVATDGGTELGPTTHDVVLEVVDDLQGDDRPGAPIGDVIEQTLEETEVRAQAVLETVNWQLNEGRVYQTTRGRLRRTDQVMDLDFGEGDDVQEVNDRD
ncbi:hypothetical protein [Halobiforma nitratireducens]|uniref:Uncharacterized protein n=1 Tax=Halobiforma nitratireducens JCM 10879 TaxID=1227454 RepID=M0LCM3_9EURY|nr:hypothetical protein [Halobiforma nitratireducens]EMA30174.1 hypothetical protein C446_16782 [Halobiforma nitratireducens JCM 10879]